MLRKSVSVCFGVFAHALFIFFFKHIVFIPRDWISITPFCNFSIIFSILRSRIELFRFEFWYDFFTVLTGIQNWFWNLFQALNSFKTRGKSLIINKPRVRVYKIVYTIVLAVPINQFLIISLDYGSEQTVLHCSVINWLINVDDRSVRRHNTFEKCQLTCTTALYRPTKWVISDSLV